MRLKSDSPHERFLRSFLIILRNRSHSASALKNAAHAARRSASRFFIFWIRSSMDFILGNDTSLRLECV